MDFGDSAAAYDLDPNPKWYVGSGFKQERSLSAAYNHHQEEWRDLKLSKITTQQDISKAMLLRSNTTTDSQNMLSFSSPNSLTLPYYPPTTSTGKNPSFLSFFLYECRGFFVSWRNGKEFKICFLDSLLESYGCGGSMMMGRVKGPFTASQWMELEHQALIYKYITLNAPIPSNLLIPIRKALETATFSGTHLRNTTYGWGAFHLGFSNSSDPEPGRCRRTDGKKWRCSRDAVADQKYCERHMNRGRHRSRKPVEGQAGHSVSNGPTTAAAAAAAATAATKVSSSAAVANTTIVSHLHQLSSSSRMQPAAYSHDNRSFLNKGNVKTEDATSHSSSIGGLKQNPSEFGLVCSDSLLNPLHKNEDAGQKSQNPLRQFMDDWPQSERTQLSISIPMPPSDFMSSTSSPISERLNLSPLRMGLGVGNNNERSQWIPVSWESSMGGPLGEVLNGSPSALSLMTDGWESSQQMNLSPTGVLQKTTFGSLSNSSTGSSPRTTGSTTLITSSMPLLFTMFIEQRSYERM
ncbi:hypothetical protein OSB04_005475 [Centaurea solstitialis]|uniref:Growth-regulating factor n=1 Tax=Centaurea solstitialis TaxID=347529 RepID=A0AA38WPP4_9ASTR|nr:hypothetical protein OSB04_005475 [Centaurea solstitialis]